MFLVPGTMDSAQVRTAVQARRFEAFLDVMKKEAVCCDGCVGRQIWQDGEGPLFAPFRHISPDFELQHGQANVRGTHSTKNRAPDRR